MEAGAEGRGLQKTDRMLTQQRYTRYMMQSEHTRVACSGQRRHLEAECIQLKKQQVTVLSNATGRSNDICR